MDELMIVIMKIESNELDILCYSGNYVTVYSNESELYHKYKIHVINNEKLKTIINDCENYLMYIDNFNKEITFDNEWVGETVVIKYEDLIETNISNKEFDIIMYKKISHLMKIYQDAIKELVNKRESINDAIILINNEINKTNKKIDFFTTTGNETKITENNEKNNILNRIIKIIK